MNSLIGSHYLITDDETQSGIIFNISPISLFIMNFLSYPLVFNEIQILCVWHKNVNFNDQLELHGTELTQIG